MLRENYLIRKMTEQDINEVMNIERDSFSLPWSKESYLSELHNNFATYLVCDYEGSVIGYGGIWVVFEDAHITNIAINKNFRGYGIGKALMLELEEVARAKKALRILLEVRPSNMPARKLYYSLDYVETGLRKGYYSDNGEDAIIMTKLIF